MKKRMLITTIVMVLVVAIALTTSSLAWFTMSASVSISEVSFGAVAYSGADLSVAPYTRATFGSSASIGNAITFYPAQGDPAAKDAMEKFKLVLPEQGEGTVENTYGASKVTFAEGTFHSASSVVSTVAGSGTKDQLVVLQDAMTDNQKGETTLPYFVGGFNVRNNGAAVSNVDISAKLNVGKANLIDPNGSTEGANGALDGDEYYVYGEMDNNPGLTALASGDYNGRGYKYSASAPENRTVVINAFAPKLSDTALAGALKVAVFTRTWTATIQENNTFVYSDSETVSHLGTYSFSEFKIRWDTATGTWKEDSGDGAPRNDLYVTTPDVGTEGEDGATYTMNEQLAAVHSATLVKSGEPGISAYADPKVVTTGTVINAFDGTWDTIELAALEGAVYSGVEITAVVWLDGWDTEAVPIAGGGLVSLSFDVKG